MTRRQDRINDLLREEISTLIAREVKDPRVQQGMTSVTEVQVSPDLRHATVFVSHLGGDSERDDVLKGLQQAAHFLHTELARRLALRNIPQLVFRFDPSIERGARLASLIQSTSRERGEAPPPP